MSGLPIERVQIENFKAIQHSGTLTLGPLTVFIGNNGSGKSSVIEALQTASVLASEGLDEAMQRFRGLRHARHKLAEKPREDDEAATGGPEPIVFAFEGHLHGVKYRAETCIGELDGGNRIRFERERVQFGVTTFTRDADGMVARDEPASNFVLPEIRADDSLLGDTLGNFIDSWQFLMLRPDVMGQPQAQSLTGGPMKLSEDGSNIGEYLASIREADVQAFNDIIASLKSVLPYADNLQPQLTSELERLAYLELSEGGFKVPGWMLSTGTLRVLALLAVFHDPDPPPVVFIEEVENGLDPTTLDLLVREIQDVVETGRMQIIMTTHSPFLLDLLPLSAIYFVERINGQPTFRKPVDDEDVRKWHESFAPGRLYTMGQYARGK